MQDVYVVRACTGFPPVICGIDELSSSFMYSHDIKYFIAKIANFSQKNEKSDRN